MAGVLTKSVLVLKAGFGKFRLHLWLQIRDFGPSLRPYYMNVSKVTFEDLDSWDTVTRFLA